MRVHYGACQAMLDEMMDRVDSEMYALFGHKPQQCRCVVAGPSGEEVEVFRKNSHGMLPIGFARAWRMAEDQFDAAERTGSEVIVHSSMGGR